MSLGTNLLKEHKYRELWQRYCGFLDLSLTEFMVMQRRMLWEQLQLLRACELGRHVMRGATPDTVEAFRKEVPLTTYADYAPFLLEQREDVLPTKPVLWQRTTGNSGEYIFKCAPVSKRVYQEMGQVVFAVLILATCRRRGDINFGEGENILYALAPPPFATGCWGRRAADELPVSFLPSLDMAESMPFEQRLAEGMRQGLYQGVDLVFGMPSVLVALGERLSQRNVKEGESSLLPFLTHPQALLRTLKALTKAKLARRHLLPRDLWSLRGLASTGGDTSLYRERLQELWGRPPLDVYGCTEGLVIAMQTWDYQAMTFLPHFNFLEFIPEEELRRTEVFPGSQPRTVLLDEVEAGRNYEVVISSLMGGAFVRYRLGDIITIASRNNPSLGIDIPQMVFHSRAGAIIDLAGFARLTEKTITQAIQRAGIACNEEWVARREGGEKPVLHLYMELQRNGNISPLEIAEAVHNQLKKMDTPYSEMEAYLGLRPVEVTSLPKGAFSRYAARQRASGADLAHLRPRRMNPGKEVIDALLQETPEVRAPIGVVSN